MITYHELRKISPERAREIVLRVLQQNMSNVSTTARILHIQPKTVRRARDGTLSDKSKRPIRSPQKTETQLEELIVTDAKKTGYRYRRLTHYLLKKYGLIFSENTVKAILKRRKVHQKRVRTKNNRSRPLYDYAALAPFAEMQLDTKHILDQNALPEEVYSHIIRKRLPLYEWNIIDVATRTRFTSYSYECTATFGKTFIFYVLLWLKAHNVRHHIHIQADNGSEFCSGSKRKEEELNESLKSLNASFTSIDAGKKYKQGIVENSHRHDDEQFLAIHPLQCETKEAFIRSAQKWQDTWNTARASWGHEMNGKTPKEKFCERNTLISSNIFSFPVLLLENTLRLGRSYVPTNYLFRSEKGKLKAIRVQFTQSAKE